jgi:hypothetical protein
MSITLLMLAQRLQQQPDTVGLRAALRESIAAVVHKVAEHNSWAETADHVVIDVASFLRAISVDSSESHRWRSIIDSVGGRATDTEASCPSEPAQFCPHLWAKSLKSVGGTLQLTVAMDKRKTSGHDAHAGVVIEIVVVLSRRGNSYHIDNVRYGLMT